MATQATRQQSKIVRLFSGSNLTAADITAGHFRPGPGVTARLVMPSGVRSFDPEVPLVIARAVQEADGWVIDFVTRPSLMADLASKVEAALADLRADK